MARVSRQSLQLRALGEITPHIQIEDVRLVRFAGRVDQESLAEAPQRIRARITHKSQCDQKGADLTAHIRFDLFGGQPQDLAKRLVEVSATFRLDYHLTKSFQLSPQQRHAFAQVNVIYNAWPYWRELVQSTLARMGIPPLIVPVFRIDRSKSGAPKGTRAPGRPKQPTS